MEEYSQYLNLGLFGINIIYSLILHYKQKKNKQKNEFV